MSKFSDFRSYVNAPDRKFCNPFSPVRPDMEPVLSVKLFRTNISFLNIMKTCLPRTRMETLIFKYLQILVYKCKFNQAKVPRKLVSLLGLNCLQVSIRWSTSGCAVGRNMEKPMSSDRAELEETTGLVEEGELPQGAEGGEVDPRTMRKRSSSRKSFRLDYRLEEEVTKSYQDKSGRWTNPWPTWRFPSYSMLFRFLVLDKNHSNVPTSKEVLDSELPVMEPYFVQNPEVSDFHAGMRVTWLGHATVLVEMEGVNILTDPIFSQRASPFQFMGPKRYRGPPCTVEQLPRIDAVLISHSHYDHLDAGSVASLNARFGGELRWFVPLGLMDWVAKMGCENVMELDWWEENCVPGYDNITFVCTPSQHWSKRTAWDDNRSLWSSWSVLGPNHRFFFAGDTGYCSCFQEIGRRFGPFDLAAIPIGAYQPRDMMQGQHVDPEEAVQIHQDLQAKQSVAIHWGTFALAYEYYLEPPVRLREALELKGLKPESFFTLHHGESRLIAAQDRDVFE